jgi:AraC-like DNA-binding protein
VDGHSLPSYVEFAPPPVLSPYVECLWVQRITDGEPFDQPVLPDGCADLVALDDRIVVAGPATRTTVVRVQPPTSTVGVRLRIGAASSVLGVGAGELRDRDVAFEELWGLGGARLRDRVGERSDWRGRLAALVDGVSERVRDAPAPGPAVIGAVGAIAAGPGRPLNSLARDVGFSERQLRRRVADAVGYSPRTLARVMRFQRFLVAARAAGPGRHLAALAADLGYADQAHLTRESNDLTGLPPAALLRWEKQRLST